VSADKERFFSNDSIALFSIRRWYIKGEVTKNCRVMLCVSDGDLRAASPPQYALRF